MVNAQQYIENNFPKHVSEIIAREKGLEGHLDLSAYPNLKFITFYNNSKLTSLKLGYSPHLVDLSVARTNITDFSFFLNTPNINVIQLPEYIVVNNLNRFAPTEVARAVRSIAQSNQSKEKDKEIAKSKQQLDQVQTTNQNLQQQITQLNNQLEEKNLQLQELSVLLFPNNPYDFAKLKAEIKKLKTQELAPQVRTKRTGLEQLITTAKTKAGGLGKIVDLLLETQKQLAQATETSQRDKLGGKIEAYQSTLEDSLTQKELQTLLNKQVELFQLEKHLENLQQNQQTFIQEANFPRERIKI